MRTLALVDGEHYPPVTRAALDLARERGHEIVAALLVGGTEKLGPGDEPPDLGVSHLWVVHEEPGHAQICCPPLAEYAAHPFPGEPWSLCPGALATE